MSAPRPKVFGVGLNKTGTKTLRRHLEAAGYRHRPWDGTTTRESAAHARLSRGELDAVLDELDGWDSCEDWPWPLLFRELDERFPDARFVLTVRDSPQRWYASLCNMAIRMGPFTLYDRDVYGHPMPHGHRAELEAIYEAHNRDVVAHFADRPDKLLVLCWDRGDGAAELYGFLGLDLAAPAAPVHENRSPERGVYRGERLLLGHLGRIGYQHVWGHRARPVRWLRPRARRWRRPTSPGAAMTTDAPRSGRRVLLLTGGVPATATLAREAARRLRAAGHDVVHSSPAGVGVPEDAPPIPDAGAVRWRYPEIADAVATAGPPWALRARRRAAIEAVGFDTMTEAIAALDPDLVIVDVELPEHALAALVLGVPVAGLSVFVNPWRRRGVPPHSSRTVPADDLASDVRIAGEWLRLLADRQREILRRRRRSGGADRVAVLREHRRLHGLGPVVDTRQWLIPCLLRGMPVLVMSGHELDFPHRPAPDAVHVGPLLRRATEARAPLGDDLERIVADCRADGRRLLYCSFGTFAESYDVSLLERVVAAVGRHHDWHLVVALGGVDAEVPDRLPPNVDVFGFVPQIELLAHADAAVVHAGTTTIHECIDAHVPMLSYPTDGLADQNGNAARIAYHGLGVLGSRSDDTADDVDGHLRRLLDDGVVRGRLSAMAAQLAAYEERGALEHAVERLLTADVASSAGRTDDDA